MARGRRPRAQRPGRRGRSEKLLSREVLTVERFAKWIPLNDNLDGLAWAVARPNRGTLRERVLVATPLIEGVRRLPYEQAKFPGVEKTVLRRILKAGRDAAGAQADAEGLVRQAVTDAILFLTEVSFRDRATEIVTEVCAAVPEMRSHWLICRGAYRRPVTKWLITCCRMRRIHWRFDTSGGW